MIYTSVPASRVLAHIDETLGIRGEALTAGDLEVLLRVLEPGAEVEIEIEIDVDADVVEVDVEVFLEAAAESSVRLEPVSSEPVPSVPFLLTATKRAA